MKRLSSTFKRKTLNWTILHRGKTFLNKLLLLFLSLQNLTNSLSLILILIAFAEVVPVAKASLPFTPIEQETL